jgi:hypothetical protein
MNKLDFGLQARQFLKPYQPMEKKRKEGVTFGVQIVFAVNRSPTALSNRAVRRITDADGQPWQGKASYRTRL